MLDTPDVFLNTICFDKALMHQAFIAAPLTIRKSACKHRRDCALADIHPSILEHAFGGTGSDETFDDDDSDTGDNTKAKVTTPPNDASTGKRKVEQKSEDDSDQQGPAKKSKGEDATSSSAVASASEPHDHLDRPPPGVASSRSLLEAVAPASMVHLSVEQGQTASDPLGEPLNGGSLELVSIIRYGNRKPIRQLTSFNQVV